MDDWLHNGGADEIARARSYPRQQDINIHTQQDINIHTHVGGADEISLRLSTELGPEAREGGGGGGVAGVRGAAVQEVTVVTVGVRCCWRDLIAEVCVCVCVCVCV